MGRQIRATGKTVDEAIWNGLNELDVSIDEVLIETVQKGSTGLLGIGAKPAIVLITEKESEGIDVKSLFESTATDKAETDPKAQEKAKAGTRDKKPSEVKPPVKPKPIYEQKRESERGEAVPTDAISESERAEMRSRAQKHSVPEISTGEHVEQSHERPRAQRRPVPRPFTTAPGEHLAKADAANNAPESEYMRETETEQPQSYERIHAAYRSTSDIPYSEEFAKSCPAAQFLSELLKRMSIDATVLAAESNGALKLRIDTESAGVLIGHRGETLDALQYLTLLVANRDHSQKEYIRISIDTQDYREKRAATLTRLAKARASTVRASGRPYRFEPMSPYERRIIHSTLQLNPYVTTHSEGNEPHRYVVITPKRTVDHRRRHGRPNIRSTQSDD